MNELNKILLNKDSSCQSVWFMRQAGRHLPEFRKIRSQNKNFIKLCLNSRLSSEITLQPIKRYNLDSAIIFSDILLVPYALGQTINFIKGEGPILSKLKIKDFFNNDKINFKKKLDPVYKAIKQTRNKLNKKKSLIAFVGAPWTLLVYMLGLKQKKNKINLKTTQEKLPDINLIIKDLTNYLCIHIENQIAAGADVVQIFDSWAGLIPNENLDNLCYRPNLDIVDFCKKKKNSRDLFSKRNREKLYKLSKHNKTKWFKLRL